MSQESGNGNLTETSLGQTTIDLAREFNAASVPLEQLDHEGFTYPDLRHAYDAWSLQQQEQVADSLAQTRQQIAETFNSPDHPFAQHDLCKIWETRPIAPPEELREFRGGRVLSSITHASDGQLLHFLGWNQASLGPSSAALKRRFEDISPSFTVEIEDMIDSGQMPPEALGALALSYQENRGFHAVDAFTSFRLSCLGITTKDMTAVAEHLILADNSQQFNDVCSHEILHGAEFAIGCFLDENLATQRSGSNTWVREAFIEHAVQTAAMTADWSHPEVIEDEDREIYVEERKLLGAISKAGDIPMRCFADAFMGAHRRQLSALVSDGFKGIPTEGHPNLLAAISYEYNQATSRKQKNAILQAWRRRLGQANQK